MREAEAYLKGTCIFALPALPARVRAQQSGGAIECRRVSTDADTFG
jgi:hypothetical protein